MPSANPSLPPLSKGRINNYSLLAKERIFIYFPLLTKEGPACTGRLGVVGRGFFINYFQDPN